MAKSKDPKNKKAKGSVSIGQGVAGSNIITGDNTVINQNVEAIKTASALFTIHAPVTDFTGRKKTTRNTKIRFFGGGIARINGEC